MALTEAIVDADRRRHAMVGLLPGETVMGDKLSLGYRRATAAHDGCLLKAGDSLRGHEFHYSTIIDEPDTPLAHITDAEGAQVAEAGSYRGHVTGTFFHMIAPAS